MKKVLSVALLLLVIGCAKQGDNSTTKKSQEPNEQEYYETGSYYTQIFDTDQSRVKNLTLCASVLDGVQISPGEDFSFNETVGRRTKEKGYEEASILIGDESGCAVGGGVCQISSTLYNAALAAGMKITERHSHSREVKYIEMGRDAAVSWGTLDLRFLNISVENVRIGISVENGFVYARIYEKRE